MTNLSESLWRIGVAWQLDRLRWVPRDVLNALVRRDGACMWPAAGDDQPEWLDESADDHPADAELRS